MTIKELFKKVDTYNEIADMMLVNKARIWFGYHDGTICFGNTFEDYNSFRKFVRHEYHKPIADKVLKSDEWEFDKELVLEWEMFGGETYFSNFSVEVRD